VEDDWDFEVLQIIIDVAVLVGGSSVLSAQMVVICYLDLVFFNPFVTNMTY
jgi:hypothetical protein